MAIKFGNLIVGNGKVGAAEVAPTPSIDESPIVKQVEVVETPATTTKVSQYIADIDVHNKINSLFD